MSKSAPSPPLYDRIGTHYDVTRRADPYLVERLSHHLGGEPTGTYLDLACGTGNYTVAVAHTGRRMHGIDQSQRMIAPRCIWTRVCAPAFQHSRRWPMPLRWRLDAGSSPGTSPWAVSPTWWPASSLGRAVIAS